MPKVTSILEVRVIAGSKTIWFHNVQLDQTFSGVAWTPPDIVYVLLSTALFDDTATRATCSELPSSAGYMPVAVTCNTTNFPAAADAHKTNGTVLTFPTATADAGTAVSFYIADEPTDGNLLYGGDLSVQRPIATGDTPSFGVGSMHFFGG